MSGLGFINYELHPFPDAMYQTPDGQDVRVVRQAWNYLEKVRNERIVLPRDEDDVFALLAREPRAAMYLDGRHENVFEHSLLVQKWVLEDAEGRPYFNQRRMDETAYT
jgi:hypothetical protein